MANWPLRDVEILIESTLADDSFIKTKQGVTTGKARVANTRVPRDPINYSPYVYFYCIPGPVARGNGNKIVQWNPDYDVEVRTNGAPTTDSEATVDRIVELMTMTSRLTANGLWAVSSVMTKEITQVEQGESTEVYYMRRGGTFKLQVVRA